ncbi:MAG TPA: GNAT family N-acetyltransferase [Gaiellaceae bacterium]|nr:GNAT family N-acetyltransferase [Gaiellaceae bacterium]
MPRLETRAFGEEHLEAAGELLAARHRDHRAAEPLLPAAYEEPAAARDAVAELWRTEGASGAVGQRDGRLVAFVLGIRKNDGTWGPNVWVENAGHAALEAEDVRDVYAAAAAQWVDEGRVRHYVLVPATARGLVDAWFRLSFGCQHAHGIREVPAETAWPEGVRPAEERDLDALVALAPLLGQHQDRSPVFAAVRRDEDEEALRQSFREDLESPEVADLVAERGGAVVGAFQNAAVALSGTHSALARPDRAVLLAWAATRPDVRGSGAGLALTQATFAWAREAGYDTIVTDWRETNLLSSRFWPARGFRRTFLRLYRHVP